MTTAYDALAELNPFRYRGYVWDTESERYYVSSRYYKPEFIRWSNADGYVSTGQGVIGCNMYAYCNNNPVIFKDPSGHAMMWVLIMALGMATILGGCAKTEPEPLPYKSADEAAKAFSEQVYSSCSYIRHEYATEIYSLTVNGQTTYDYNEPHSGGPHEVYIGYPIPDGTVLIAFAHTHPNSNSFSPQDKRASSINKTNLYLVGSDLKLQLYNYLSGSTDDTNYTISPLELTDEQRIKLVTEFKASWESHIEKGCEFNCQMREWPTP